ncbi:MAG: hypothetical protein KAI83_16670 [Thiomargarita sp.]|nr:hypothetical protein [Thiomargarita sp.]
MDLLTTREDADYELCVKKSGIKTTQESTGICSHHCLGDRKMMNLKERELSNQLFTTLKRQFPEIDLVEIVESPVQADGIRVRMIMPEDEDKEIEIREKASEISTDILLDYGYLMLISSASRVEQV